MSCSCKHTTEEEKQRKAYQKKKWKCDICDLIIYIGSKCAHLRTVIEVHISNVFAREEYRHQSFLSKHCKGIITGLGLKVYELGMEYFVGERND